MDNLPKDNQNNDSNIITNSLGDNLDSKIPETPPEKQPENIPEKQEEVKQEIIPENPEASKEETIEIGSLDKPSISTLNQEINSQANDQITPVKKNKKGKTITSFVAILLIIAALPTSLILVKQRQDIRKEAASGTVTACGVTVATAGYKLNSNFSYTGKYFLSNTSGRSVEMTIRVDGCACNEGNLPQCNNNCIGENKNITVPPSGLPQEITTPSNPDECGTFQTDIKVMSCKQL